MKTNRIFLLMVFVLGAGASAMDCRDPKGLFRQLAPNPAATVHLVNLHSLPRELAPRVRAQILALAQKMYDDGHARERKDTIFPIQPDFYDAVMKADAQTQFSQVLLDDNANAVGFVLAHYDGQGVELEKIGVAEEHRQQGLMRKMIRATAERADQYRLPRLSLLVRMVNDQAMAAYEKLGFVNTTPPELRNGDESRGNAYQYVVGVKEFLRRNQ